MSSTLLYVYLCRLIININFVFRRYERERESYCIFFVFSCLKNMLIVNFFLFSQKINLYISKADDTVGIKREDLSILNRKFSSIEPELELVSLEFYSF